MMQLLQHNIIFLITIVAKMLRSFLKTWYIQVSAVYNLKNWYFIQRVTVALFRYKCQIQQTENFLTKYSIDNSKDYPAFSRGEFY
jgi:hypothetical protein